MNINDRVKTTDLTTTDNWSKGAAINLSHKTGIITVINETEKLYLVCFDKTPKKWWGNQLPSREWWFNENELIKQCCREKYVMDNYCAACGTEE